MSEETYSGIAIVGMAGRFPGAESIEEFWANLIAGKESVSFFTDAELKDSGFDPVELRKRGQYVPARGLLKDVDCFDATFFGVSPKEAEVIDPQHRVFLETCWVALERAGYAPNHMPGAVGIFAGATFNTYFRHALQQRPDLTEMLGSELVMFGNEKDYMTTRVAYKLGLKGPALSISTACSTALVAVCQACRSLLTYESDMALAGGVSITVPQKRGYYFEKGYIGSPDGHTRTFDEKGAGTIFSNGVGVVVLKRLEDAVRDKDQVYAVIKGAALNNDGSQRVSFGAPGIEGQSEAIAMAHALAEVDPETITYVEAHGTATPLGDPIEVAALTQAFRLATDAKQFCGIGSVKTNIGHLDAAAGIAGLIKVALALRHRLIPASLHFEKPNPKIDLANSPFFVNAELRDWTVPPGIPRRAGVSSFGSGGTNAHVVVEEAPELPSSGPSRPWQLLPISAKTPEALDRATADLAVYLKRIAVDGDSGKVARELADAAFTLQIGRGEFIHRRMVACQDPVDGAVALEAGDPKRVFTHQQDLRDAAVVFMFPGQGAQYIGMGAEVYRTEPLFRAEVDRCAEVLTPILQDDIRCIMFPPAGSEKESDALLIQTKFTQPALFVIEYALARLWMSWGIKPAAMIGHSVGEYVAGCLAGVFSLEDALMLVARRGALAQAQPAGAMLAVRLPEQDVRLLLPSDASIAAINAPALCVASGPHESIARLEKQLDAKGVKVKRLQTSHAFHSAMMEPMLDPFTSLLKTVQLGTPSIPYVSNVSGQWITAREAQAPEYWAGHVRQAVRFADGVAQLMKDPKQVLLEVGPGQTLSRLAKLHPDKQAEQPVLASLPLPGDQELRGLTEALGRLWMVGVTIDWQGYHRDEQRHRAVLPTYPFERKRYWPDAPQGVANRSLSATVVAPVCGEYVPASPTAAVVPPTRLDSSDSTPRVEQSLPRKGRLLAELRSLMQELSGYDLSAVDASADLLELGLDSLLLTQAAQLITRKFSVHVSFRQLMEELSSLEAIASHLDAVMPPDVQSQPQQMPVVPVIQGTPPAEAIAQPLLEQILLQQQQLTNQILQLMGRQPTTTTLGTVPTLTPPASLASSLQTPPPSGKSHGPFKPFDKHASTALPDEQKRGLEQLIDQYTKRTAGSKKLAGDHRTILADPRSVAGFNRLWKEMVYPIVSVRSDGSKVWDVDGNEYVDFVMGFGADFFGHRPPFLVRAVHEQLDRGFEIGPIQPIAYEVATLIKEFTGMERVGFTNTGSEAILAAMRVARTVSGRDKIAVFAGAYHGIFDEVLFRPLTVNGETRTAAIAPGIPDSALAQVIVLDYGNPQSLDILRSRGSEIAAVFVEPVQARRLDLQPVEFLRELRRVTQDAGMALVFDEVVTGFRVHPGGAQAFFGIRADLATYGKVIGGGIPIGVVTGSAKYMDALDGGNWQYGDASFPEVGVTFFAGTCVRHPLALAAAKSVLLYLKQQGPDLQKRLTDRTVKLAAELRAIIDEFHAPYQLAQFSSLMTLTYTSEQKLAGLLFYLLRLRGILIWENRNFIITTAHSEADLVRLVTTFRDCLSDMRNRGLFAPSLGEGQASRAQERGPVSSDVSRVQSIVEPEKGNQGGRFALTEAQREIWLAAHMGGHSAVAYNESHSLEFRGPFDVEIFRNTALEVVHRHPILLARISEDGQWQEIVTNKTIDIPFIDLSKLSDVECQRELAAMAASEGETPFDLATGPLVRIKIIRVSSERHVVMWTGHHVVYDGWSAGLVVNELGRIYSARRRGVQPQLDQPASFQEYAAETRADSPALQAALTYWQGQYRALPPLLEFPSDRPRPAVRSAEAAAYKHRLDPALKQALKRLAGKQRTTLVALLLTGFKTLLYRLTGVSDLAVGIASSGQIMTGKTCLVGHCVNVLPIRTTLQPEKSVIDNLAIVRRNVMDGTEYSQVTLGQILQHLEVPRSLARPPLIEIAFNVDPHLASVEFDGTAFSCDRNQKKALHFDLFFNIVDGVDDLLVECDFNTDLFETRTIVRWLAHYQTVLEGIVANPSASLDEIPLLTERECQDLSTEQGRTAVAFPEGDQALHQLIEAQVCRSPERCALVFENERLSYGQLNGRANMLAVKLREAGVKPGELVGLFLNRSLDLIVGILGILKAGAAYVPIDPTFPQERVQFIAQDGQLRVMLTQTALQPQVLSCIPETLCLDKMTWSESGEIDTVSKGLSTDHLAYVIYTSGSTGKPKGVCVEHRNIVNYVLAIIERMKFTAGMNFATVSTIAADLGNTVVFPALVTGGTLHLIDQGRAENQAALAEYFTREGIDVLKIVPSHLAALQGARNPERVMPRRCLILGGEASRVEWIRQLQTMAPACEIHNHYGPTETAVGAVSFPVHTPVSETFSGTVPLGRPLANYRAYVLDKRGQHVPVGVPGELCIGGLGVSRGYLNRDDLTRERFIPDPFSPDTHARLYRTGDRVRRLDDGNLEFLGRVDHQVKIRGYRIELGEVETVLREHPGIQEAVAIAREDASGSKQLVTYIVPKRADQPLWSVPAVHVLPDGSPVAHLNKNETDYIYQEVFVLQAYLRHGVTVTDGDCIIDAGSNIGLFTVFANRVARNLHIFSFEPNPTVFQCLQANAAAWGTHTKCFPCGLSSEEKTAEMTFFEGFSLLSGFYADEGTEREVVKNYVLNQQVDEGERARLSADIDRLLEDRFQKRTVTARLRTLSGVMADEHITKVDLLKVNVEKSELDVLHGLSSHDWAKIRQLVIEVDLKENLGPITTLLKQQGYDTFVEQDPLLRKTELCYIYAIRPSSKGRLVPSPSGPAPGTAVPLRNPEILAVPVLKKFLGDRLPHYMVPSSFVILEKFPLTANGKIDRAALPAPSFEPVSPSGFVEPRTEVEKALASIWSEVLKIQQIGIHHNFFELGGHSLLVIRAVSRIRDIFSVTLTPREFFANPTITMLAQVIEGSLQSAEGSRQIERGAEDGPAPLSFAQERMWFLYQLAPESPAYNIVDLIQFTGLLDVNAMKSALQELVQRHDMLRTRFTIQDGEPVQEVLPALGIELPVKDVRQYPVQEQEAAWIRVAQVEGRKTFDLTQPPLFRCMGIQLTDAHLVVLTLHHIIADEWSMEVLQKELRNLYEAARQGQSATLPALPIRYADFSRWQRAWLQGEVLTTQLNYWKEELVGLPALLELPTDRPRPVGQSFRGAMELVQMPSVLLERLKVLGQTEQTTLFMTLLAGFMALLHKYAGQDDLAVGTPISGRTRSEMEGLIGLFLNTVVVRGTFTPVLTFRGLLRQVRERALGAYGHQDLPFEQLVAELAPERAASHAPLFQTMFILNSTESVSQTSNAVGLAQLGTGTSKFDLTFYVSEDSQGLQLLIEYSTDLFDRSTVQRMGTHFQQLLELFSKQPDGVIADASILPDAERTQVIREWNNTGIAFPEAERCVHTLFEVQAHDAPDRVALVVGAQQLTFQELNQKANQLAHHLVRCGVGPNVLVGLCVDRSVDMVVGVLGILKAGGAYIPLDPSFPQERLNFMVEDSGMSVLVAHHGYQKNLSVKNAKVVDLDVDRAAIETSHSTEGMLNTAKPSDLAYVLYTSGSTGKPKGVEIQHSALTNFLLSMRQEPGFTSADRLLAVTTLSFDIAGLELYLPLITGGTVVLADSGDAHDPARLAELIRHSSCSVMQATPATWWALIHSGWKGAPHLKVLCGGEPLTDELARELLGRCKELWNMYGPTETTIWSTVQRITEAKGSAPIGRPIANTQVFVMDVKGHPVPIGVTGELYIGGAGVARGYLGRQELTQERFVQSPFDPNSRLYRTGDLARWRADGTLVCLGRADSQVKVRGFRIELGEVEAVLYRHAHIKQCAVTVHERTPGDKVLVAHFASHPGATPSTKDLRRHLLLELPEYMVPSIFVPMDTLPLTPNGKVDRKVLPMPAEVRAEKAATYAAPQDSIEQVLTRVWSNVLKVSTIGIHDNFFELGGHSILAVRIIIEIEKLYGRRLPLATLIQAPTIGELAAVLRKEKWAPLWSSLVPIRGGGARPPLFLFHSHGGNVLEYYPLAERLDADQPVYALQAQGLDGRIVPDQSMEDMVREYLKEVRSLQPAGPYYLAGFCFGGLAALEAARQLTAAGESVALVGMIQTMYPTAELFPGMSSMEQWWYRIKKRIDLEWESFSYRRTGHITERVRRAADVLGAKAAITLDRIFRNGGANVDHTSRSMPYILERLAIEHEKAYRAYRPHPFSGDIVLFRVQYQLPGVVQDRSLGWKSLLGDSLDVCDMPGHQQNLLSPPHVQSLAKELMGRLKQAQGVWAGKSSTAKAKVGALR